MADLNREERLRIRSVICDDAVALWKWGVVVDYLISWNVDVKRIKDMLEKNKQHEAVLETLQFTNCGLAEVLEVLRCHGLNSLAEDVESVSRSLPKSTPNHVWYKVGELPHNFTGRVSEPAALHRRLGEFHSNRSVDTNIVSISGPPGCGKSTLARKYAFDNFPSFYSDVIWVEAGSVEKMKTSFGGLAAELELPAQSDTQKLVSSVYEFFQRRKCLFIFDGLQRMEDLVHFRPNITSPLCHTPYLLITTTRSGLTPNPDNELCIAHDSAIVLQIFKRIEREEKSAADLLKVLAYLDPEKISVRFLQAVFERIEGNGGGDFEPSLTLLRKLKVIKFSSSSLVIIHPSVQEAIRPSLTAEEESSAFDMMQRVQWELIKKEGAEGTLARECTAHQLHVLRLDLTSISLTDRFKRIWNDFWFRSEYSSALLVATHAHMILESRFGGEHEATIDVRYKMTHANYRLNNYSEAIQMAESLLPVAKSVLGEGHGTIGSILSLLSIAYEGAGDSQRASHYHQESGAFWEIRDRIRDLLYEDPIVHKKWGLVVDDVVPSAADVLKIIDALKRHDYGEAVLQTLQRCNCDLIPVLRKHGLNSAAAVVDNLTAADRPESNCPTNHVWYEVGELPHDFTGRDSESTAIHTRLSDFHSNRSVDANIVCITGPPGCGKSTLARKYAFDNYSFYDSNVIWVEAESVEEMRVSFEGLAAELQLPAESDTRVLVTSIYKFFNRRKCLFIFDGLERMEDFSHFRPKITSPLSQTPYLLFTSRKSGLAPDTRNELCISHYKSGDRADEASATMAGPMQERPREGNPAGAAVRDDGDWAKVLKSIEVQNE